MKYFYKYITLENFVNCVTQRSIISNHTKKSKRKRKTLKKVSVFKANYIGD